MGKWGSKIKSAVSKVVNKVKEYIAPKATPTPSKPLPIKPSSQPKSSLSNVTPSASKTTTSSNKSSNQVQSIDPNIQKKTTNAPSIVDYMKPEYQEQVKQQEKFYDPVKLQTAKNQSAVSLNQQQPSMLQTMATNLQDTSKSAFNMQMPTPMGEDLTLGNTLALGASASPSAIASGAGGISNLYSSSTSSIKAARAGAEAKSIQRVADMFSNVSPDKVKKLVDQRRLNNEVIKIVDGMNYKKLAKMGLAAIGAVASTDVLVTWYALDNVIGGQKFFMKDILAGVKNGSINPIDAQARIDESMKTRENAMNMIDKSTTLNPLLWPFRNLIMAGAEDDNFILDDYNAQINAYAEQAGSQGVTGTYNTNATDFEKEYQNILDMKADADAEWLKNHNLEEEEDKAYWEAKQAEDEARDKEMLEFWKKYQEEKAAQEAKYFQDKWDEFVKEQDLWMKNWEKRQSEMTPSNLKFGLL